MRLLKTEKQMTYLKKSQSLLNLTVTSLQLIIQQTTICNFIHILGHFKFTS